MKNWASSVPYTVIIPARLGSSRLPNKPLADIAGLPMVVRVAQAVRAGIAPSVRIIVAADSAEVVAACSANHVAAILTRANHPSGSDRLAEASQILGLGDEEVVVNVQGDEPLIDPLLVAAVADSLRCHPQAQISTAAHPITKLEEFVNPNVVKVVVDACGLAMYFSRAPIPWWRDGSTLRGPGLPAHSALRHIGIYAYRVGFLKTFPTLVPSPEEQLEVLEQLRAMWHGYRIAVHVTEHPPGPGVDTVDDLQRVRNIFLSRT